MKLSRRAGATSQIFQIFIADTSSSVGGGLTGLTNASGSLTAYYHRDTDTTATVISLVSMTVGTFTSSGFKEIDATNMPGWYQFCPPNAALATSAASCAFHLKGATNMAPLPIEVDLDSQVDVYLWNGTAVASPATAGIPDVNAKNINNVATTSVTTISANQGTTQPINFTGTGASALVKGDTVDIAGAAVSATTAQLGVNVVNWNNTVVATPATAGIPDVNTKNWNNLATVALPLIPTVAGRTLDVSATGESGVDWANVGSPTTTLALTGTTISTSQVAASVTNDVGITQAAADKVFGTSGAALAELAAVPSATPTPRNAMMLIFMALRNKLTVTSSSKAIFNDAGSSICSKALADDGTTYTESKAA